MKASIYLRVSSDKQEEDNQLPECMEFIKSQGWDLHAIYQDKASGYKDESKRNGFNNMITDAKARLFDYIVVWNMDRFSRQPPEQVLDLINILATMYDVKVKAVHGDTWSQLVETISNIKDMGFMGKAISEFLETMIRGLEHQRAYSESKVKSERIKLAVRKKEGNITRSYKGKKWGRKSLPKQTQTKILELRNQGISIRKIAELVKTYDKHGNAKKISKSSVHKTILENQPKKLLI